MAKKKRFVIYQYLSSGGGEEQVLENAYVLEAVNKVHQLVLDKNNQFIPPKRIIVMDADGKIVFEWKVDKGITFPLRQF